MQAAVESVYVIPTWAIVAGVVGAALIVGVAGLIVLLPRKPRSDSK